MAFQHFGVLFILGFGIFGGALGAQLFQRLRIPQVVGYIVIGLVLGESGLQIIRLNDVLALRPLNLFALGVIGFLVGGELRIELFRRYGRQFLAILLGEGIAAFVAVGICSGLLVYIVTQNVTISAASGIVFGAIASATDPASTINVLWEYRTRGVVTTTITAIVALDDALAMTLYGLGTTTAEMLTRSSTSILSGVAEIGIELFGAIALGLVAALLLRFLLRWLCEPEKSLALSIGLTLLLIAICVRTGLDVILAAMAVGFGLVNMAPRRSAELFRVMRGFSLPIFVIFFVLVGARLTVSSMPSWLLLIVATYVIGRSAGKMLGAWFGARLTNCDPAVRRYLGLGLFAQGGVAVGLSIMASQRMGSLSLANGYTVGDAIIFGVTTTTLILQIIGPPLVKFSMKLAGEIGKNITEDDVIASMTVADVMERDVPPIPEYASVSDIIERLVVGDQLGYPVVDRDGRLVGKVSLTGVKNVIADQSTWRWLVGSDVMEPVEDVAFPDEPLQDVIRRMRAKELDCLPVVRSADDHEYAGVLYIRQVRKKTADELLVRQQASPRTA